MLLRHTNNEYGHMAIAQKLHIILPFHRKHFNVLQFRIYLLALPLNRRRPHHHLFLYALWWERENKIIIIIREEGLEICIFEIGECLKDEVSSGLPRSLDTSGVTVSSEHCDFTVKALNYIGLVIIKINGL